MRKILACAALFAALFPALASADVYLVRAPATSVFTYGHVAVDAEPVDGVPMVAEFQRSPDGLILVRRDVFISRYPAIDIVPNGLTYRPGTRFDGKRYIILPILGLRSNCTTFASAIDPDSRRYKLPDMYARHMKKQAERAKR